MNVNGLTEPHAERSLNDLSPASQVLRTIPSAGLPQLQVGADYARVEGDGWQGALAVLLPVMPGTGESRCGASAG
jgi:hypothetical protein